MLKVESHTYACPIQLKTIKLGWHRLSETAAPIVGTAVQHVAGNINRALLIVTDRKNSFQVMNSA